jgi:hypothetical protein
MPKSADTLTTPEKVVPEPWPSVSSAAWGLGQVKGRRRSPKSMDTDTFPSFMGGNEGMAADD